MWSLMRMRKSYLFEIPVGMIKYYLFCPRIPYFVLVMGVRERITDCMIEGLKEHKKFYRGKEMANIYLKSEKLGIYGYVDAIMKTPNGYKVIEFKSVEFNKRTLKSHLYQAVAYALLVEENFGRVISVVLKYKDKTLEFPLTVGLKRYVRQIINKIREICEIGLVPEYKESKKCKSCGFAWICRRA